MRVKISRAQSRFALIPNDAMRDRGLSIEARGMLAMIMTHSDGYTFIAKSLQSAARIGRDKFQKIMRELSDSGYVLRRPARNENGKLEGWEWLIFDNPNREPENPVVGDADCGNIRRTVLPSDGESGPIRRPKEKEEKEEKNIVSNQSRKVSFPEDWAPSDDLRKWATAQGFEQDEIANEVAHCAAYYGGRGERFIDLGQVFTAWLLRAKKHQRSTPKSKITDQFSKHDPQTASILAQLEAKKAVRQ